MSYTIKIPNGILTMSETIVECPICSKQFDALKYDERLHNAKKTFITITCEGCKNRIGLTMDMKCDYVCFELESFESRIKRRAGKVLPT